MIRKLALVLALLFMMPAVAGAWGTPSVQDELDILVFEARNSTGADQATTIPTTTIVAKEHKLLGFVIYPYDGTANSEFTLSVRDTVPDGSGGTVNEVIAEAEVSDSNYRAIWFPYPKTIHTQISIVQGANTDVLLYYAK